MEERISDQHGDGGDDDAGGLEGFHAGQPFEIVGACGLGGELHGPDHVAQDHLERLLVAVVDEEDGRQEEIPVGDDVEQGQGQEHRDGQGQHDTDEYPEIVGAVDDCGLFQFAGQGLKVALEHDHVEGVDGVGPDEGAPAVDETDLANGEVERDQAGREDHLEDDQGHEDIAGRQVGTRKRIGAENGHEHLHQRGVGGNHEGVTIGEPEGAADDEAFVGVEGETDRPDVDFAAKDGGFGAEGAGDGVEEGGYGDEGEDAEAQIDQDRLEAEAEIAGSDHLTPEQQWLAAGALAGATDQVL